MKIGDILSRDPDHYSGSTNETVTISFVIKTYYMIMEILTTRQHSNCMST